MNTPSVATAANNNQGKLSLALCIGGLLLALVIGFIVQKSHYRDAHSLAYFVFVAFEITALAIGLSARREPLARGSAIAAGSLLLLSIFFAA